MKLLRNGHRVPVSATLTLLTHVATALKEEAVPRDRLKLIHWSKGEGGVRQIMSDADKGG